MHSVHSVFVVSAVAIYREGISSFLARQPDLFVLGSSDVPTARAADSDVCLFDRVSLAAYDLSAFCATLRRSQTPVLVLGLARDQDEVMGCLEAGAAGYVTRDETLDDLHRAVTSILDVGARVRQSDLAAVLLRLRANGSFNPGAAAPGGADALTCREREVADLMCRHLSNKEIASILGISVHTAKHHVRATLSKLGVERRGEVAVVLPAAQL